ncbi:MAG: hypothetical protein DIU77_016380 [Thermocrispum agreste]|uniref:Uncharacterized protein n=1 Tax=Thermocrispum agreste TaxID=37925 RepID=A0ABD6FIS5_9PSEU
MAEFTAAQRERAEQRGQAMPGGRFPIRNRADLLNAIRAVGRARPQRPGQTPEQARAQVRRHIMRRARALGLERLIPDTWRSDGTLRGE